MIRILHVIKSLGRGGAEMLLPETLKLHNKDDFEFHYIYFLPWKDQMVEALAKNGGRVKCFASNDNIRLLLKARSVAEYVKEHKIQLIHAHLPWAGILARIVGKLTGVPVVYTEHNKQERYHFLTRLMNLSTMGWLTEIFAVSKDVEESILSNKPGLRAPLTTILNGVDVDKFCPGQFSPGDLRHSLNIPIGTPLIGTVAVFRFQKRLDVWLQTAKSILNVVPEAKFVIVGDGPLKHELGLKAKELGLQEAVIFAGLQTEVRPFLAAFDLYMMSSIFEGLPIAMLEAMAMGCAVITTDAGGIKEVIRHEEEGLLCSVDEPQRLADFAIDLINDREKRRLLGQKARRRVEEAFSLAAMVNALETKYQQIAVA